MKKFVISRRLLALILAMCLMVLPVFAAQGETDISVTNGCHSVDAKWSILGTDQLVENCESAMLYEMDTDTMMYAWNADVQIYPAGLVKLMTALLVVENAAMDDAVTVRQDVLETVDTNSLTADLVADEVLTVRDLMYCMMVGSANDAAAVLAAYTMGSQEAFVEAMNARAKEIGCENTNFVNVHGLHDSQQVTTPRDLLKILREATKNEVFNEFFSATYYTIEETNKSPERKLVTENYLVSKAGGVEYYYDSRVIGSRTGISSNGYRSVASMAEKNGMRFLCLITGSPDYYSPNGYSVLSFGGYPETSSLLTLGYNGFVTAQPLYQDQAIRQVQVSGGESDLVLGVSNSINTVLPSASKLDNIRFEYSQNIQSLQAPIEKGTVVGTVTLWSGSICIGSSELYAMNNVSVQQLPDSGGNGGWQVLGKVMIVLAVLVVLFLAVLLTMRWIRILKVTRKKQTRNRRRR